MSNVLAVFGATGLQGGSVVDHVLSDPHLSQMYKIRAITRDVNSKSATELKKKVNVVQGDAHNRASLETALEDVHTVLAIAAPTHAMRGATDGTATFEAEYNSAKTIADVAIEKGAKYIIFSTLPAVKKISGGMYTKLASFDAKAQAEQYIRGLPIKSAFYSMGAYMQNFQVPGLQAPRQAPDGSWVMVNPISPKSLIPMVDVTADTGKFVGAILADPEKYEGKTFTAAARLYEFEEIVAIISKAAGETIIHKQVSYEEFAKNLPPGLDKWVEMYKFIEEFGYYGPGTKDMVEWSAANARGRLLTFEQFFDTHSFQPT